MIRIEQIELEQNFENYFDRVEAGESFMITVNGKDTVVMIPYVEYETLINQTTVADV